MPDIQAVADAADIIVNGYASYSLSVPKIQTRDGMTDEKNSMP